MKPTIIKIAIFLLLLLIAFLLYLVVSINTKKADPIEPEQTIQIDTVIDTIYVRKTTYIPKIVYRDTPKNDFYSTPMDTTIHINDCYIYNVVVDTVVDDSVSRVIITDTLFMNTIISRTPNLSYYVRNYRTRIITPAVKPVYRPGFFAGIMSCGNMNRFGLGVSANYVVPRKSNIGLSYDFINKQVFVSYSWYLF